MSNEAKTHVIDGNTFVEVERKAEVGDRVLVFRTEVCTVTDIWEVGHDTVYKLARITGRELQTWFDSDDLRVLEPVDQTPQSTEDVIANLVRRVHSLEQQLRNTQRNVERQGVEIANIEAATKAPQSGAKLLAEAFEALAKYERSVGR